MLLVPIFTQIDHMSPCRTTPDPNGVEHRRKRRVALAPRRVRDGANVSDCLCLSSRRSRYPCTQPRSAVPTQPCSCSSWTSRHRCRIRSAAAEGQRKCDVVADALNRLLSELTIKCAKEEGVRDYFSVSVIGYGGSNVGPALAGPLAGRDPRSAERDSRKPCQVGEPHQEGARWRWRTRRAGGQVPDLGRPGGERRYSYGRVLLRGPSRWCRAGSTSIHHASRQSS